MKKLILSLLISAVALASLACGSGPEASATEPAPNTSAPEASAGASEPKATSDNEPKASASGTETSEPTRAFAPLTPEPTRGPTFTSKLLMMPTRDFSDVPLTRDEEMRCAVLERDWNELSEYVSSFGVSPSEVFRYEHDIDAYLEACRARGYSLTPWDIPQ